MNKKSIDEQLRQNLRSHQNSVHRLKRETWNRIETELFPKKRRNRRNLLIALATSVVVTAGATVTEPGQAVVQSLTERFLNEQTIDNEMEGMSETNTFTLEANEEWSYVIYIDEERYALQSVEQSDLIVPSPPINEDVPEVSMEILKTNRTKEQELNHIYEELQRKEMDVTSQQQVSEPVVATKITAMAQGVQEWNSPIRIYYIMEPEEGTLYVIKQAFFLEATEGHGQRFDDMLQTFEAIKK
ncbi:hypothetical protein N781_02965 [Pontibacillus halophilus JSM 076056 = DSM 19796]|uniref:DUF4367 domain-containing protein n=1 Tax=Pontibacillus halophilus JSM 076056 = DSM 19796 TaxID=1385510 RepID=A0A0A5GLQ5_9BACI|nr:hypothetical protein [Pontibacillus halophilus]KGX92075.1 hypothetical protein N781_02965 [Pontibacillus halophilus JSM 076056 = DSM 19796]